MKAGNRAYNAPGDLPEIVPVFPLPAALLLPRSEMPLNIFEPRYIDMVDTALHEDRIIGMIQPDDSKPPCTFGAALCKIGCAGRISAFSETEDGRYLITLTGIARFTVVEELTVPTAFRQCRISTDPFAHDFCLRGDGSIDREAVLDAFRAYLSAHHLEADWDSVYRATNETLVNALAMMAPFGTAEKQALLEAPDLKTRAETLVALTEMALAGEPGGSTGQALQ